MIGRRVIDALRGALVEPGNIDLNNRPVVHNPDGTLSTVASFSFQDDDGSEVLLPMIAPNGMQFANEDIAIWHYKNTGQHLGKFSSPEAATAYAQSLHRGQERQYAPSLPSPPPPLPNASTLGAAPGSGRTLGYPPPVPMPRLKGR